MSRYSAFEHSIARALEATPALRRLVRDAYYAFSYLTHREAGFTAAVVPGIQLQSAAEWAGIAPFAGPSFFGYYDKSPFSPDGRFLLQHEIRGRMAQVVAYDRQDKRRVALGESESWTWQQGAQACWLDGETVGYNTMEGGRLGLAVVTLADGARRFVPFPMQALLPGGQHYLSLNSRRLAATTPDYGIAGAAENFAPDLPPEADGVWRVDLTTGAAALVLDLATLAALAPRPSMAGAMHYVNHCLPSPDGTRFLVLHRWVRPSGQTLSRLILAGPEGGTPNILLDDGKVSHCAWRDARHFVVWGRHPALGTGYHLIEAETGAAQPFGRGVADAWGDGHPSFSHDGTRFLADSYPDKARQQHLFLYDAAAGQRAEIGRFLSPWTCRGARRCDLHPRLAPDEKMVCIDSAHSGVRQSYVLNLDKRT